MAQHVKILGVLHIILGAFGVLAAIVVFAVFGGLAVFLGGVSTHDMNVDARTAATTLEMLQEMFAP